MSTQSTQSTQSTVYFIAGGNRGIGLQLVKQISEKPNTHVITSTRDIARSSELAKLAEASKNIDIVTVDYSDEESIKTLSTQLEKVAATGIDIYVHNAGISEVSALKPIIEVDTETYLKHYRVNTLGPILTLKQVFPFLQRRESKKIIFITSGAGSVSGFFPISSSAYGQSKAALNYTARSIAFELKPQGFTTIVLHPGVVETDMSRGGLATWEKDFPEMTDAFKKMQITPEESARLQIQLYEKLTKEDNDKFYNFDGSEAAF